MTQQLSLPRAPSRELLRVMDDGNLLQAKPNAPPGRKSPVQERIAMFKQSQSINANPNTLGVDEYGRPVVGSKTEQRGMRAHAHVFKEIVELCEIIHSEGTLRAKDEDGVVHIGILFSDLFRIYTVISDKCVGLLLRARKHHFVEFEGETLFQKRDDHVPIFLSKPLAEIKKDCNPSVTGEKNSVPWQTGVTSTAAAT